MKIKGEKGEILNFLMIVFLKPTYMELIVIMPLAKHTEANIEGNKLLGLKKTEIIKNKAIGKPKLKKIETKERRQKLKIKMKEANIRVKGLEILI
jgi:hypothetical protein